jgi:hypothetical protein
MADEDYYYFDSRQSGCEPADNRMGWGTFLITWIRNKGNSGNESMCTLRN